MRISMRPSLAVVPISEIVHAAGVDFAGSIAAEILQERRQ
jgi:hypothetical protein